MELNRGRLKATLVAGRIRPTDEALATLSAGLSTISYGYHIERVISEGAKTEAERRKELSQTIKVKRVCARSAFLTNSFWRCASVS
jgi:hypothetical protein